MAGSGGGASRQSIAGAYGAGVAVRDGGDVAHDLGGGRGNG